MMMMYSSSSSLLLFLLLLLQQQQQSNYYKFLPFRQQLLYSSSLSLLSLILYVVVEVSPPPTTMTADDVVHRHSTYNNGMVDAWVIRPTTTTAYNNNNMQCCGSTVGRNFHQPPPIHRTRRRRSHFLDSSISSRFVLFMQWKEDDDDAVADANPTVAPHKSQVKSQQQQSQLPAVVWSYDSALAIVPPDPVWDTIQRARHLAGDTTVTIWPPTIRLFHPFVRMQPDDEDGSSNTIAFDIANIIEQYNISTFPITLSKWSIIPHVEQMNFNAQQQDMLTTTTNRNDNINNNINSDNDDIKQIKALIRSEEDIGKQKLLLRQEKLLLRNQPPRLPDKVPTTVVTQEEQPTSSNNNKNDKVTTTTDTTTVHHPIKKRTTKQQQQQENNNVNHNDGDDIFNGPCVICLEPDRDSARRIQELRQLLADQLFSSSNRTTATRTESVVSTVLHTSPTSSVSSTTTAMNSHHYLQHQHHVSLISQLPLEDYRPVVPIAAFPNVQSAIPVAKHLRSLWKPVSFNVTDLHIISSSSSSSSLPSLTSSSSSTVVKTRRQQSPPTDKPPTQLQQQQQFGCDVLITLMGVPLPTDENYNNNIENSSDDDSCILDNDDRCNNDPINMTEIIQLLCDFGEPGGYSNRQKNNTFTIATETTTNPDETVRRSNRISIDTEDDYNNIDMDASTSMTTELERWLYEEDEEYDEGTVVIIGRTQFFTGEMRQYVGMPATTMTITSKAIPRTSTS